MDNPSTCTCIQLHVILTQPTIDHTKLHVSYQNYRIQQLISTIEEHTLLPGAPPQEFPPQEFPPLNELKPCAFSFNANKRHAICTCICTCIYVQHMHSDVHVPGSSMSVEKYCSHFFNSGTHQLSMADWQSSAVVSDSHIYSTHETSEKLLVLYIHVMYTKNCNGGARETSDPWTAAVLVFFSREFTYSIYM